MQSLQICFWTKKTRKCYQKNYWRNLKKKPKQTKKFLKIKNLIKTNKKFSSFNLINFFKHLQNLINSFNLNSVLFYLYQ